MQLAYVPVSHLRGGAYNISVIPAIEFRAVTKNYGSVRALRGIDLTVEPGQVFGFLGPNGAGKTTAIRILLDLIRATSGQTRVLGFDCMRNNLDVRHRTGYLPGDLRLYDSLRGYELLDFIDSFRPQRLDPAYRAQLVERLHVDVDAPIRTLSKGNKQKLALVQAMMHLPELLILDEPTSGLDPLVQQEVALLLEETVADGRTVFFSSHVLPEVERLSHSVAIIREGVIVAVEDIAKLKSRSMHVVEVTFDAPPPWGAFAAVPGVVERRRDGAMLHLEARDGIDALVKALARYRVLDLRTEQPSLEDLFLAYYEGGPPVAESEARNAAS
jgi:ABC-2 type transport system ATP-binding protein